MPFAYDPPGDGALRQGEILSSVTLIRPTSSPTSHGEGEAIEFTAVEHPRVIILHGDCDLEQDFNYRQQNEVIDEADKQIVPEVLICTLFEESQIKGRAPGRDVWRRMEQNQDMRYHKLQGGITHQDGQLLPDLFIDFKRCYMERPVSLYTGIREGNITRVAKVPDIFVHDLIHRFFSYHSRVALPPA